MIKLVTLTKDTYLAKERGMNYHYFRKVKQFECNSFKAIKTRAWLLSSGYGRLLQV